MYINTSPKITKYQGFTCLKKFSVGSTVHSLSDYAHVQGVMQSFCLSVCHHHEKCQISTFRHLNDSLTITDVPNTGFIMLQTLCKAYEHHKCCFLLVTPINWLRLRVAQVPRCRDLSIFVVTTDGQMDRWTDRPINLPLRICEG